MDSPRQPLFPHPGFAEDEQRNVAGHHPPHDVHERLHGGAGGHEIGEAGLRQWADGGKRLLLQRGALGDEGGDHLLQPCVGQAGMDHRVASGGDKLRLLFGILPLGDDDDPRGVRELLEEVDGIKDRFGDEGLADDDQVAALAGDALEEVRFFADGFHHDIMLRYKRMNMALQLLLVDGHYNPGEHRFLNLLIL